MGPWGRRTLFRHLIFEVYRHFSGSLPHFSFHESMWELRYQFTILTQAQYELKLMPKRHVFRNIFCTRCTFVGGIPPHLGYMELWFFIGQLTMQTMRCREQILQCSSRKFFNCSIYHHLVVIHSLLNFYLL